MAKKEIEYLMEPIVIKRTATSQIRVSAYKNVGEEQVWVHLREFCKYLNKREEEAGVTFEDAPYKPSPTSGATFRLECVDEIIGSLKLISEELIPKKRLKVV